MHQSFKIISLEYLSVQQGYLNYFQAHAIMRVPGQWQMLVVTLGIIVAIVQASLHYSGADAL
jgi:hypothetical protein